MGTELRGTIHGPNGAMDARLVAAQFSAAIELISNVEDIQVGPKRQGNGRSTWAITHLGVGSVKLSVAPLTPMNGADFETLDQTAVAVIEGLDAVEHSDLVPAGWSVQATKQAGRLASKLGATIDTGMAWQLFVDGEMTREVHITHRTSVNARQALRVRHESIGSAIGRLGSIGVMKKKTAGLWLTPDHQRIPLSFTDDQFEVVRNALNQEVQVSGRLMRNAEGQLLRIAMNTMMPGPIEHAHMSKLQGIAPNFTGELSTLEYLDGIRGAS